MSVHQSFAAMAIVATMLAAPARGAGVSFDVAIAMTDGSLILVPVVLNGRPYSFALDTGASTTMIDTVVAEALKLTPAEPVTHISAGGEFLATTGTLDELQVGGIRVPDLVVSWMPLVAMQRLDSRIAGVLGQDVLAGITLTIDYPGQRIRLTKEPCGDDGATLAFERADGRPMIAAHVFAPGLSPDGRFVIDSAANALILFGRMPDLRTATLDTHAAPATGAVVTRAKMTVGGLLFETDAIVIPSEAHRHETGLLPTAWFSRVCIDGPRRRAVLRR